MCQTNESLQIETDVSYRVMAQNYLFLPKTTEYLSLHVMFQSL